MNNKIKGGKPAKPATNNGDGIAAAISAFGKTFSKEARATRAEQAKQDKKNRTLQRWTLFFLVITTAAVIIQACEMIKVYQPIRDQADAAKAGADAAKAGTQFSIQSAQPIISIDVKGATGLTISTIARIRLQFILMNSAALVAKNVVIHTEMELEGRGAKLDAKTTQKVMCEKAQSDAQRVDERQK